MKKQKLLLFSMGVDQCIGVYLYRGNLFSIPGCRLLDMSLEPYMQPVCSCMLGTTVNSQKLQMCGYSCFKVMPLSKST